MDIQYQLMDMKLIFSDILLLYLENFYVEYSSPDIDYVEQVTDQVDCSLYVMMFIQPNFNTFVTECMLHMKDYLVFGMVEYK
jgi:hypothetical protein